MKAFLPCVLILLLTACSKRPALTMPTATQSGSNLAACYINGREDVYNGNLKSGTGYGVIFKTATYNDGSSMIDIDMSNNMARISLVIPLNNPVVGKLYQLHSPQTSVFMNGSYFADSTKSYISFTRFDSSVVAGTFYLATGNSSLVLTDGFFDIAR